jgi:hypothetical protein
MSSKDMKCGAEGSESKRRNVHHPVLESYPTQSPRETLPSLALLHACLHDYILLTDSLVTNLQPLSGGAVTRTTSNGVLTVSLRSAEQQAAIAVSQK